MYTPEPFSSVIPSSDAESASQPIIKAAAARSDAPTATCRCVRATKFRPPGPSNRLPKMSRSTDRHPSVSNAENAKPDSSCTGANRCRHSVRVADVSAGREQSPSEEPASFSPTLRGIILSSIPGKHSTASAHDRRWRRARVALLETFLYAHVAALRDILFSLTSIYSHTGKADAGRTGEVIAGGGGERRGGGDTGGGR